jgi:Helix-turn-helix domain
MTNAEAHAQLLAGLSEQPQPPHTAPAKYSAARGPPVEPMAYRINDAVRASGLSRSTLYVLIAEGTLPSRLISGRRLILRSDLEALVRGEAA